MARAGEQISPERLCEAAEASLRAAVEVAEYTGGPWPYPLDLLGGPLQPGYLGQFARWEVQEACEFLVRMGFLERPRRQRMR